MNFQNSYHLITPERHFTNSHRALRSYISLDRSSACEAQCQTNYLWAGVCHATWRYGLVKRSPDNEIQFTL